MALEDGIARHNTFVPWHVQMVSVWLETCWDHIVGKKANIDRSESYTNKAQDELYNR